MYSHRRSGILRLGYCEDLPIRISVIGSVEPRPASPGGQVEAVEATGKSIDIAESLLGKRSFDSLTSRILLTGYQNLALALTGTCEVA